MHFETFAAFAPHPSVFFIGPRLFVASFSGSDGNFGGSTSSINSGSSSWGGWVINMEKKQPTQKRVKQGALFLLVVISIILLKGLKMHPPSWKYQFCVVVSPAEPMSGHLVSISCHEWSHQNSPQYDLSCIQSDPVWSAKEQDQISQNTSWESSSIFKISDLYIISNPVQRILKKSLETSPSQTGPVQNFSIKKYQIPKFRKDPHPTPNFSITQTLRPPLCQLPSKARVDCPLHTLRNPPREKALWRDLHLDVAPDIASPHIRGWGSSNIVPLPGRRDPQIEQPFKKAISRSMISWCSC